MRAHNVKVAVVTCILSALAGSVCFAIDPGNSPLITKDFIESFKKRSKEIRMHEEISITMSPEDASVNRLWIGNAGFNGNIRPPLKLTTLCLRKDGSYDVDSFDVYPRTEDHEEQRASSARRGIGEGALNNYLDARFFSANRTLLKQKILKIMRENRTCLCHETF